MSNTQPAQSSTETMEIQLPAKYVPPQSHVPQAISAFASLSSFESAQRMANALAASKIVPETYQNNTANCLVALEVAQRTGASVMAVMQSLHIIKGRPSWSSQYIIAAINSCGRFSPLKFSMEKLGTKVVDYTYWEGQGQSRQKKTGKITVEDMRCIARATDRNGEELEGPPATIEMAVKEGWYTKSDSKWVTMPELMVRYRAAAFFGRLYAPEILMGMHSEDELIDVTPHVREVNAVSSSAESATAAINERIKNKKSSNVDVENPAAHKGAAPETVAKTVPSARNKSTTSNGETTGQVSSGDVQKSDQATVTGGEEFF